MPILSFYFPLPLSLSLSPLSFPPLPGNVTRLTAGIALLSQTPGGRHESGRQDHVNERLLSGPVRRQHGQAGRDGERASRVT